VTSRDFTPDQLRRLKAMFDADYHRYVKIKSRMDDVGIGIGDPFRAKVEDAREAIYQTYLLLKELESAQQRTRQTEA
jgi:hypothetical protein